ncbi:MAG: hypothetical protein JJV90_00415, partial [Spiroplasma sp.]|nr:hypothetical protein [Mycoplasmatales bacterium]
DNKSTKHQEKQEKDIYIKNAKNPYSTIICRFCSPLPGDVIYSTYRTGYYSNNEYIIHRHGCLVGIVSNEAKWNNVTTDEYVARMNFTIQDLSNSIAQTLAIFKNNNITSINFRASLGEQATGKISAKFNSLKHFNDRLEEFEKLENVIEVERRFDKEDKKWKY